MNAPEKSQLPSDVEAWMRSFADHVRRGDYAGARKLFSPAVEAFGTVAPHVKGLDCLIDEQWKSVWGVTEGFEFDYDTASAWSSESLICVAARWQSSGFGPDQMPFPRTGRATLLLGREGEAWVARHTHFSMTPAK